MNGFLPYPMTYPTPIFCHSVLNCFGFRATVPLMLTPYQSKRLAGAKKCSLQHRAPKQTMVPYIDKDSQNRRQLIGKPSVHFCQLHCVRLLLFRFTPVELSSALLCAALLPSPILSSPFLLRLPHATLSQTFLSHTTLCHTELIHTQHCDTPLCHTQLCHKQLCHT